MLGFTTCLIYCCMFHVSVFSFISSVPTPLWFFFALLQQISCSRRWSLGFSSDGRFLYLTFRGDDGHDDLGLSWLLSSWCLWWSSYYVRSMMWRDFAWALLILHVSSMATWARTSVAGCLCWYLSNVEMERWRQFAPSLDVTLKPFIDGMWGCSLKLNSESLLKMGHLWCHLASPGHQ